MFPFRATSNWIVLAVRRSVKYYFAHNSPIFCKRYAEEKETFNSKAFRFTQTQTQ